MKFSDPQQNVLQLGLRAGMKVADLGSGVGHHTLTAASIVGNNGRVYAVDIQEEVLKHLASSAITLGLRNVETVWGNIEKQGGTTLKDQSMDAVILSNTLFQLEEHPVTVAEIKRILKPGGRLLVIDWAASYDGMGPRTEQVVPEHVTLELFITNGFHKLKDFRSGPHHYSIVFTAP
jgi:ubiquinone/menaquinone biosynthesis C-methylase UbiE|tara:strand:- start:235970 stop:236500 length:531 start_codon:yes stop_codon:yes gene_type:complete